MKPVERDPRVDECGLGPSQAAGQSADLHDAPFNQPHGLGERVGGFHDFDASGFVSTRLEVQRRATTEELE